MNARVPLHPFSSDSPVRQELFEGDDVERGHRFEESLTWRSPIGSAFTICSTSAETRRVTRICPPLASLARREARLATVPIAL